MNDKRLHKVLSNLAEVAAATPKVSNFRVAAAILYKNRIISYGVNSYKTSPFQKRYSKNEYAIHFHAEIAAIKNSLRYLTVDQLSKAQLIVCRINVNGLAMSKPCTGCQRAIAEFGIRDVYYSHALGLEKL
jgi:deoxycytidylate deaminase